MQTRRRSRPRRGFTLVEVLLVLVIVGVLAAMVVPNLMGRQKEANIRATRATISRLETTLEMYAMDHHGEFPQGGQETLSVLTQPEDLGSGHRREPYLPKVPTDAWGAPLHYRYPSTQGQTGPDVWSSGPDGKNDNGSGDDINNWD